MMSREQGKWYSAQGVGGLKRMQQENIDLSQGIYSCYNGVFKGFCPLYMVCGAAELLATDSKLVYEKAKAAGVDVTCVSQPFMCHNFANFGELFPEATRALEKVITWSKQKLP
jgi:monoterpene epsilon-lactone hydrolase